MSTVPIVPYGDDLLTIVRLSLRFMKPERNITSLFSHRHLLKIENYNFNLFSID